MAIGGNRRAVPALHHPFLCVVGTATTLRHVPAHNYLSQRQVMKCNWPN